MSSRRQSPTPRRVVPIKRADGEPLTRSDIQYDLLSAVFNDNANVFTNPWKESKLTCFKDLYLDAILNSPKATKALKDKMLSTPQFGTSFAMLSLLVNVGRINTTMSFFPEMKTAIRTYHPIPALQKTEGNLQDAPRIKHILKANLLLVESGTPPITPQDIISRSNEGRRPSTSVTNLLFILSSHSVAVQKYFKPTEEFPMQLDFLDLFLRTDVSSTSRAQAFLWTCWKFLENHGDDASNPFAEPGACAPIFVSLSQDQAALENVDPEEDKDIAEKLMSSRDKIVKSNSIKETHQKESFRSADELSRDLQASSLDDKHESGSTRSKAAQAAKERKALADKSRREKLREKGRERLEDAQSEGDVPELSNRSRRGHSDSRLRHPNFMSQSISSSSRYRRSSSPHAETLHQRRYAPYKSSKAVDPAYANSQLQRMRRALPPSMTMVEHAWHMVMSTDALVDSDEELGDDNTRLDYSTPLSSARGPQSDRNQVQRMRILSHIRGKSPTPGVEDGL